MQAFYTAGLVELMVGRYSTQQKARVTISELWGSKVRPTRQVSALIPARAGTRLFERNQWPEVQKPVSDQALLTTDLYTLKKEMLYFCSLLPHYLIADPVCCRQMVKFVMYTLNRAPIFCFENRDTIILSLPLSLVLPLLLLFYLSLSLPLPLLLPLTLALSLSISPISLPLSFFLYLSLPLSPSTSLSPCLYK